MSIITKKAFSTWVEMQKLQNSENSYLEIVKTACDEFEVDYEFVKPLLSDLLIRKIEAECVQKRMIKPTENVLSLHQFLC